MRVEIANFLLSSISIFKTYLKVRTGSQRKGIQMHVRSSKHPKRPTSRGSTSVLLQEFFLVLVAPIAYCHLHGTILNFVEMKFVLLCASAIIHLC